MANLFLHHDAFSNAGELYKANNTLTFLNEVHHRHRAKIIKLHPELRFLISKNDGA